MSDSGLPLQAAIFEVLTTALAPTKVYDNPPQNQSEPHVVIGEDFHVPWDTDDSIGSESLLTLHTWSVHRGKKEVKTIQGQIYDALHRYELVVNGFSTVTLEFDSAEVFKDQDGESMHGVSKFRALVEAT
jgi:hypothetical protein